MNYLVNELILAFVFGVALYGVMYHYLGTEISCEFPYAELNISSGENLSYNGSIKNIGSKDIKLRFSAEGLNHISIAFIPKSTSIRMGEIKPIIIQINGTGANSDNYKGWIYIRKGNTQEVLERIPITIHVKKSSGISC
jgi:hypothetical protein